MQLSPLPFLMLDEDISVRGVKEPKLTQKSVHANSVQRSESQQKKNRKDTTAVSRMLAREDELARADIATKTACFGYAYFTPRVARMSNSQVDVEEWEEFRRARVDLVEYVYTICPRATRPEQIMAIIRPFTSLVDLIELMYGKEDFFFNLRRVASRGMPRGDEDPIRRPPGRFNCRQLTGDPSAFVDACIDFLNELENAGSPVNPRNPADYKNFMQFATMYPEDVTQLGFGPSVEGGPHYLRTGTAPNAPFRPELVLGAQFFFYFLELFSINSSVHQSQIYPWLVSANPSFTLKAGAEGAGMNCAAILNRSGLGRRFWHYLPTYPINTWIAFVPNESRVEYDDFLSGRYERISQAARNEHYVIQLALPYNLSTISTKKMENAIILVFYADQFKGYYMVVAGQSGVLEEHDRRVENRHLMRRRLALHRMQGRSSSSEDDQSQEKLTLKLWRIGSQRTPPVAGASAAAAAATASPSYSGGGSSGGSSSGGTSPTVAGGY